MTDDSPGPPPAPSRPWRRRLLLATAAAAVVGLGAAVWGIVWYEQQVHAGPPGAQVIVQVPSGASAGSVTAQLVRQHVVGSGLALRIYDFFHGTPVIDAGGYALRRNASLSSVHGALADGPDVLVVPAGFTVWETAERLSQLPGHDGSALAAAVTSGAVTSPYEPAGADNLDGLLGAGEYVVGRHQSGASLLSEMVDRFDAEATAVQLPAKAAALGVTPYQAVIIASIVQKEGVYPQNLAKVARVVYNRLALDMPLQMDSTVLYAEHRDGGPVTSADLSLNTPYNTYLYNGLTPTPICFPSTASLKAALNPAPGAWLYFVLVSSNGTEAFSDTLAGQEANEQLAKSRGLP
ncbi:MAG TPA: endolytic transglycosylase MltG [Acidimicrobiales bacterium]|nr:endolytic transglycosylase MltG [Acidimicrobiales bacterium]